MAVRTPYYCWLISVDI